MASIQDERGYNQGYRETPALIVRTQRRIDAMLAQMNTTQTNVRVLEIGCGTGMMANLLATRIQGEVVGLDLSHEFITEAAERYKRPNLKFAVANLNDEEALNLGKFDYIVGNGILHHLYYNLDEFLGNLKKFLNPGGKLIFWEPNLSNPYAYLIFSFAPLRKIAKLEPAEMAFTADFINKILKRAGYNKVGVECRDFLLPNTPTPLIGFLIWVGNVLERFKITSRMAQSLFITAGV